MRHLLYILLILLAAAAGCSRQPADPRLLRAEALIDSLPGRVLADLDSLDADGLSSAADRALYALLLTKARDKNYIFDKDDSLITSAVDFFTASGDDSRLMQALFYQGQVKYNADSLVAAMPCLLASLDIASARADYFMQGKCHELIGLMYFFHYNQDKALSHSKKAAEYYTKAGKELFAIYSNFRVATGLSNSHKYKESLALLDSLAPLIQDKDDYTKAVFYANYLWPLYHFNRGYEALDTLRKLQAIISEPLEGVYDYYDIARVYLSVGQLDSAKIYIQKYGSSPNYLYSDVKMNSLRRRFAASEKDYESAYNSALEEMIGSDRKLKNDYKNALAFAERDYYRDRDLRNEEISRRKILKLYYFIGITLSALIALGLYYILMRRKKEKEVGLWAAEAHDYFMRLKQSEESHSGAVSALNKKETELAEARNIIETLYKNKFFAINELSQSIFDAPIKSNHINGLSVEQSIANLNNEAFTEKVKTIVGSRFGDKVSEMINMIGFNQKEELMIWLMAVKFSPNTICLFMGLSKPNYYTSRSRIIKKIMDSAIPKKEEFVREVFN